MNNLIDGFIKDTLDAVYEECKSLLEDGNYIEAGFVLFYIEFTTFQQLLVSLFLEQ